MAEPFPPRRVPIEPILALRFLTAVSDLPGFTAAVERPAAGTKTLTLVISNDGPLPIGPFEGTISLTPVLVDGTALSARRIKVRGSVVPDLELVPPAVHVGGRRVGEVVEEQVTLRSLTGRSLPPVRAVAEGEGLIAEATEDPSRFRVRQTVLRPGPQQSVVRFATAEGQPVDIELTVEYIGVGNE
jgi:hypothetical protein